MKQIVLEEGRNIYRNFMQPEWMKLSRAESAGSVGESLFSMCRALGSIPNPQIIMAPIKYVSTGVGEMAQSAKN